jgi:hypothetical protein
MTDYTKFEGAELNEHCGDNAMRWAQAFIQLCSDPTDKEAVFGWFANAIETSHDKRTGNGPNVLPDGSAFFIATV